MDYNKPNYREEQSTAPSYPEYRESGGVQSMTRTIITIIGIVAIVALGYIQSERFRKNMAIDGCFQTGRVQLTQNDAPVTVPEEYWYDLCMERKGFK